ncbi:hypothetical protein FIL70_04460 [Sphingobium fuliginis ATCC 27551]|uniref:Uncharacterized protein n=1 Tax=Sphingobium fuliginis ATCC 27551 TaxID=1208342 RepID=A0A5B8CB05_SPHSA|nr:hypothetical protein FIL70_04460 [Sphingobium fuliginis ATCC 27551]
MDIIARRVGRRVRDVPAMSRHPAAFNGWQVAIKKQRALARIVPHHGKTISDAVRGLNIEICEAAPRLREVQERLTPTLRRAICLNAKDRAATSKILASRRARGRVGNITIFGPINGTGSLCG